jgi:hypothetical protein
LALGQAAKKENETMRDCIQIDGWTAQPSWVWEEDDVFYITVTMPNGVVWTAERFSGDRNWRDCARDMIHGAILEYADPATWQNVTPDRSDWEEIPF